MNVNTPLTIFYLFIKGHILSFYHFIMHSLGIELMTLTLPCSAILNNAALSQIVEHEDSNTTVKGLSPRGRMN